MKLNKQKDIKKGVNKFALKMFLFITALIFMFISKLRFPKKVSIYILIKL